MRQPRHYITYIALAAGLFASYMSEAKAVSKASKKVKTDVVSIYLTSKDGNDRLTLKGTAQLSASHKEQASDVTITASPEKTFQTFLGMGGAFTDAAAETFYKMPADKQKEIITAYFDKDRGIGYTLGRINMNSCDFSSDMYTYLNEGDTTFKSFSIAHDKSYKIPFIKLAMNVAKEPITFFSSPWSPPAWMKTNNDMLHGGKLDKKYMSTWASYFVHFIDAYKKEGINIWGTTVQNEPLAVQTWESCIYTAEEERDFVKHHLGPTFARTGTTAKIICWDHNRGVMFDRGKVMYDDPEASKYVWGLGFHWYVNDDFEQVERLHNAYPDKNLLFTEGCLYPFKTEGISDWSAGETYAKSVINDLNGWSVGWTDWNLILDETGGPNHVGNFCFAPIIADTKTKEVKYMNSFYYLGHFSKFIRPGAKRIAINISDKRLMATAFINKNGSISVVAMNNNDTPLKTTLEVNQKRISYTLPAHSIATFVL